MMLKRAFRPILILRYSLWFLIPVLLTMLLTCLSVQFINSFVREKNERISTAIARQLSADISEIMRETDTLLLSYTTDFTFFSRLGSILGNHQLSYDALQTLRALQETVDISHKIRPYIRSIYCVPQTSGAGTPFMISQEGVYQAESHADGAFILRAMEGAYSSQAVYRIYREGSISAVPLISRARLADSLGTRHNAGVMIVNLDVRYIQSLLLARMKERSDDYYLITDSEGSVLFASLALQGAEGGLARVADLSQTGQTFPLATSSGQETLVFAGREENPYGFIVHVIASTKALYATSDQLIAVNLAAIAISIAIGIVCVIILSTRRYADVVRVGKYMERVEEEGSLGTPGYADGAPQTRFGQLQAALRLQLSERELRERRLELELLRNQLNPHFLLNTLQMLNWKLMRELKGYTELNEIVECLLKILSYSLYPAESLAPLRDEIRYTDAYIALQAHTRHAHASVGWQLGEETLCYRVPRLLFQPILENAFKHAFAADQENTCVTVAFEKRLGDLVIRVQDNGSGMPPDVLQNLRGKMRREQHENKGIGLANTNKRIKLMFGRRFGLEVDSAIGSGTTVTITLPILVEQAEDRERRKGKKEK